LARPQNKKIEPDVQTTSAKRQALFGAYDFDTVNTSLVFLKLWETQCSHFLGKLLRRMQLLDCLFVNG
jgi:hypothetical protein